MWRYNVINFKQDPYHTVLLILEHQRNPSADGSHQICSRFVCVQVGGGESVSR